MRYLPHTEAEIESMLRRIGVDDIDALFDAIPAEHRLRRPLDLEPALPEAELMRHLAELAGKNTGASALSFLGAGMYDHHVPPAVDQLLLRSEFYTAYTPYQAEVSQGTLQAIFEFQTLVCQLFELEVANASMYDAASGAAEAALMARRLTDRRRIVASAGLHPDHRDTVLTYLGGLDDGAPDFVEVPLAADGTTDLDALARAVDGETACVLVGYPNFLGAIEDLERVVAIARAQKALVASITTEPYALSLVRPPGALGVDIAVGEGQALAVPPQFGGPGVGLFACRKEHLRQIPGRLVGETVDTDGQRGYVLTLSTREQHIRRERATSNICTNHGLIALAFTIRTAMLGRTGFERAGRLCLSQAEHVKAAVRALPGWELPYAAPTFNEFVVRSTSGADVASIAARLAGEGLLVGLALGRFRPEWRSDLLVAVTEKHTRADLDRLVGALARAT